MSIPFSWLHGDNGKACTKCGNRMDGREKKWDIERREFVAPAFSKCAPCRTEEAKVQWSQDAAASNPSTSPSDPSLRATALTFLGRALGAGPR